VDGLNSQLGFFSFLAICIRRSLSWLATKAVSTARFTAVSALEL